MQEGQIYITVMFSVEKQIIIWRFFKSYLGLIVYVVLLWSVLLGSYYL